MSGPDELRPDLSVIRELKLQNLGKFLSKLSEKEELVIRLRYGFGCKRAHTFQDIGKTIDVKGERARQIYWRAMRKLKEEKGLIECLRQRTLL